MTSSTSRVPHAGRARAAAGRAASTIDPLSGLRAQLFGSAFVLVQHLGQRMDGLLAPMGVTTRQWLLLAVLSRSDRPLSLTEAAARYGSSRQNVKAIAVGLERRGYLRLEADPMDARTIRLHLTEAVQRFDEPAAAALGSTFLRQVFAGLDAGELRTLDALMRRWLMAAAGEAAVALGLEAVAGSVTTSPVTTAGGTP